MKRSELRVRDPYIVTYEGCYYLYVTTGEATLSYYVSRDLTNWKLGGTAFVISEDSWAYKDVWAAEVHPYRDKFYLFVSLKGKNELRGTQIAVADTPAGPFVPVVNGPATPADKSCIDGTLFVQEGIPYMVYSRDWPDHFDADKNAYVGQIYAVQLSEDLKTIVAEPRLLFESDEAPISKATPHHIYWKEGRVWRYGSDAPFVQTMSDGSLVLTWSPYLNGKYVVLCAISKSGDIYGPWTHSPIPLYDKNGGHAMFFDDLQGRHCMCLHGPESAMLERALLFEMAEKDGKLIITKEIE